MDIPKSKNQAREQRILDAAAELIIHYGYDKTSVSEIAEAAGISKGAIYLHFASKDALFEALLAREMLAYSTGWLAHIEADPQGGTIGSIYKAMLYALNHNAFMSAIVKQDMRIFGNYLRKPNNLFASLESPSPRAEFLQAMQAAGAIRPDVDAQVMTHIMDLLSYGFVGIGEFRKPTELPPYDTVLATIAEMMDRMLTPSQGNPGAAGKAVIRQIAAALNAQLAAMQQTKKADTL